MENVLTYLLQVNLLLVIVFLGYQFLLKNLTFYKLNRVYFIIGTVYALVYPFIDVKSWFQQQVQTELPAMWQYVDFGGVSVSATDSFRLYDLFIFVIGLGLFVFLLKLVIQLSSMFRIHFYSKPSQWRDYLYRNVLFPVAPFSFFNKIYVHKEQHREMELEDIFEHEYIHVKGRHTIDILMFEIVLIGCWYNPFVWLMRKAVRQNLEFLTDQQVLNKGVDRQTYQYSLLNVTKQGAAVGLGNQFNFKTLKKRIMMMNKKRSSRLELSKYAFLLPIVILTGASFTVSQAEEKIEEVVEVVKDVPLPTVLPIINDAEKIETLVTNEVEIGKDKAIYILDNKSISFETFKNMNHSDLESVHVTFPKEKSNYKITMISKKNVSKVGTVSKYKTIFEGNGVMIDDSNIVFLENGLTHLKAFRAKSQKYNNDSVAYVLDGKLASIGELKKLDATTLESVVINFDNELTKKYGKKSVLNIKTKKFAGTEGTPSKFKGISFNGNKLEIKGPLRGVGGKNAAPLDFNTSEVTFSDDTVNRSNNKISDPEVISVLEKSSFSNTKPLFVVDGKPVPADFEMKSIKANDIESITILKDKSATALYGEKGKDGVILITTKKDNQKEVVVTGYKMADNSKVSDSKVVTVVGKPSSGKDPSIQINGVVKGGDLRGKSSVSDSKVLDQVTVIGFSDKASEDTAPQPKEGMMSFRKWIGNNYAYPSAAIKAGAKGTIQVSFVVEKDGSLSEITVVQDIGHGTGEAAVELLKKAPKWNPGTQNGVPVRVQYTVPIKLDLSKK